MKCKVCGARIEASVGPLWLALGPDGQWSVFGIGEKWSIYCQNDHPIELTEPEHVALEQYVLGLEKQLDAEVPANG